MLVNLKKDQTCIDRDSALKLYRLVAENSTIEYSPDILIFDEYVYDGLVFPGLNAAVESMSNSDDVTESVLELGYNIILVTLSRFIGENLNNNIYIPFDFIGYYYGYLVNSFNINPIEPLVRNLCDECVDFVSETINLNSEDNVMLSRDYVLNNMGNILELVANIPVDSDEDLNKDNLKLSFEETLNIIFDIKNGKDETNVNSDYEDTDGLNDGLGQVHVFGESI